MGMWFQLKSSFTLFLQGRQSPASLSGHEAGRIVQLVAVRHLAATARCYWGGCACQQRGPG